MEDLTEGEDDAAAGSLISRSEDADLGGGGGSSGKGAHDLSDEFAQMRLAEAAAVSASGVPPSGASSSAVTGERKKKTVQRRRSSKRHCSR